MTMSFLYRIYLDSQTELQPFQLRTLQRDPPEHAMPTAVDLENKIVYYYAPDNETEYWGLRFNHDDNHPLSTEEWTRECDLLLTAVRDLDDRLLQYDEKMWLPNAVLRQNSAAGEQILLPALPCDSAMIIYSDIDYQAEATIFDCLMEMVPLEDRVPIATFRDAIIGGDFAQARFVLNEVRDKENKTGRTPLTPRRVMHDITNYFSKVRSERNLLKRASEKTVPLATDDLYYRLAMISEGHPEESRQERGLVNYILIDEFVIGRDPYLCDLVLDSPSVGRLHARIIRHGSHYFIEDLGSTNATFIDDKKLKKRTTYLLPDRARLRFADRSFYFTVESDFS